MHSLLQSLRYTIQLLLKTPGFTLTAVLILGFGIGVNTAIFSLINTVLLNPLTVPRPDQLVQIFQPQENDSETLIDYPDYVDLLASQHSFDSLSVWDWSWVDFSGQGNPEHLTAVFASSSLFQVTNLPFILGRPFGDREDKPGGPLVVILNESLWRNRFNSDPNVIGKNLRLSGENFQVIGVCRTHAGDLAALPSELLYMPLHVSEFLGRVSLERRGAHTLNCVGRLKEGIPLPQAQADLEVIQSNLVGRYPDTDKGYGIHLVRLLDISVATYSLTVWLLGAAVGCLLLISCANVANLLFARALERRKEMAIRAALGASRLRLLTQLLPEIVILSLLGGALGLLVAWFGIGVIKAFTPDYLPRFQEGRMDTAALAFILGVTALASLISGLLPTWSLSKAETATALKDEGGNLDTTGRQRQRTQSLLVVSQVAIACILLVGASLLIRSFQAIQTQPLGFDSHHLLTVNIHPTGKGYSDQARLRSLFDTLLEKARRLPGVTNAGLSDNQPFEVLFGGWKFPFSVAGQPDPEPGKEPTMNVEAISPGYFGTLRIGLLKGRDFDEGDRSDSQRVIIVNEALANRFFPGQEPIGKQIRDHVGWMGNTAWTIVGVVQNTLHGTPDFPESPFLAYTPYTQRKLFRQFLLLRTPGDPSASIPAVRKIVAEIDPEVPVDRMMSFDDLIADRLWSRRLSVLLVSSFSGVALFLSAVGLYGILAYSVSQRKREIGVRIALGANRSNILRLVIRQGLKLVVIGLVVGIAASLVLVRFIENILFGVSGSDPVSILLTVVVLGAAALVACLLPALRATRIRPITALRE